MIDHVKPLYIPLCSSIRMMIDCVWSILALAAIHLASLSTFKVFRSVRISVISLCKRVSMRDIIHRTRALKLPNNAIIVPKMAKPISKVIFNSYCVKPIYIPFFSSIRMMIACVVSILAFVASIRLWASVTWSSILLKRRLIHPTSSPKNAKATPMIDRASCKSICNSCWSNNTINMFWCHCERIFICNVM